MIAESHARSCRDDAAGRGEVVRRQALPCSEARGAARPVSTVDCGRGLRSKPLPSHQEAVVLEQADRSFHEFLKCVRLSVPDTNWCCCHG